jgi:hypothetical protein
VARGENQQAQHDQDGGRRSDDQDSKVVRHRGSRA